MALKVGAWSPWSGISSEFQLSQLLIASFSKLLEYEQMGNFIFILLSNTKGV